MTRLYEEEKLPYPKSVFFIVSNEFCERFSYYGMRTILSIYLTDMLFFSEPDAKIIYHTFTMLVYFFPLLGAILADSFLGKFRTIFYVSMIYACGNILLALAATPPIGLPATEFSMLGLVLIALGTGGIKPCVSAFGGDQFTLPQQAAQLANFFSIFYFAINLGSFVSTFLTPVLRDQQCFESNQCFTLAFGVPGILMIVSIIIFGLGKNLYKVKHPEGNVVIRVSKCIGNAISQKIKSKEKKDHWLDHAEEKYGKTLVNDVKALLRVLVLYIPLPVFWALFDQQGTGWTFMARRMDGDIGFYTILPDQMQVVNPILILAFIPIFEKLIYPLLNKLHVLRTPLQRLVTGGVLAAVAFAISAIISLAIEAEAPVLPHAGNGQLILYNNIDTDIQFNYKINGSGFVVPKHSHHVVSDEFDGRKTLDMDYEIENIATKLPFVFEMQEEKTVAYFLNHETKFTRFEDSFAKDEKGAPLVRPVLGSESQSAIEFHLGEAVTSTGNLEQINLEKPGLYQIRIGGEVVQSDVEFKLGGVYTVFIDKVDAKWSLNVVEITAHNGIHMLWIIPQYVVLTMAEIMYSITGLEFSYSQSPISMKSVLQACWLLTTAFGNLIVVIIESVEIFEEQSYNFFLYAGLMLVDMFIFALMAMRYKYVENIEEAVPMEDKEETVEGVENGAFNDNNKGDKAF